MNAKMWKVSTLYSSCATKLSVANSYESKLVNTSSRQYKIFIFHFFELFPKNGKYLNVTNFLYGWKLFLNFERLSCFFFIFYKIFLLIWNDDFIHQSSNNELKLQFFYPISGPVLMSRLPKYDF